MNSRTFHRRIFNTWTLILFLGFTAAINAQTRPDRGKPARVQAPNPGLIPTPLNAPDKGRVCCIPVTVAQNQDAIFLEPTGALTAPYRVRINVNPTYANILRTYTNYINSIDPCATRFVIHWALKEVGPGSEESQWIYVDANNPNIHNSPHQFSTLVQINTWYQIRTGSYFEPNGCGPQRCVDTNTLIRFQIEVQSTTLARAGRPSLVINNGKKDLARIPLTGKSTGFSTDRSNK